MASTTSIARSLGALGFACVISACDGGPAESAPRTAAAVAPIAAESASLARAALDTVGRASGSVSEILRYEVHGDSVRIVTMPDQRRNRITDGMAVIWLRRDGRILRVAWSDSA